MARKSSEQFQFVAKTMRNGRCISSVQRPTQEAALREALCSNGDTIELWKVRLVLHPIGKWWSERDRVLVDGGAA